MAELECIMRVFGDCVFVNTFDAAFRAKQPPQWADQKNDMSLRYSLHALRPVPEDILRHGYRTAGRLWCEKYWGSTSDLRILRIKKGNGVTLYRFTVMGKAPTEALLYAAYRQPQVQIELIYIEAGPTYMHTEDARTCIVHHRMDRTQHMTFTSPNRTGLTTRPDSDP